MGKVTIYIRLVNGSLDYRDNEHDHGHSIKTSVDPGDTVVWKLDKCSGISEITGITVSGDSHFFSHGPQKKDFNEWHAEVGKKATGGITYVTEYVECIAETQKSITAVSGSGPVGDGDDPPSIIIKA